MQSLIHSFVLLLVTEVGQIIPHDSDDRQCSNKLRLPVLNMESSTFQHLELRFGARLSQEHPVKSHGWKQGGIIYVLPTVLSLLNVMVSTWMLGPIRAGQMAHHEPSRRGAPPLPEDVSGDKFPPRQARRQHGQRGR